MRLEHSGGAIPLIAFPSPSSPAGSLSWPQISLGRGHLHLFALLTGGHAQMYLGAS